MKTRPILHEAPDGSECPCDGARLAGARAITPGIKVRVF